MRKKTLFIRRLATASLFALNFFWASFSISATTEEQNGKFVESRLKTHGPLLKQDVPNSAITQLNEVFEALANAQQKILSLKNDHTFSANSFYVFDSPTVRASVSMKKIGGVNGINAKGIITTGFIKKIFTPQKPGEPPEETVRRGISMFAGAMAHELAHAIEESDSDGVTSRSYSKDVASQPTEVRTDIEAIAIEREAGFPASGLYQVLQIVDIGRQETLAKSVMSTHPQKDFRNTTNRIALLTQRLELGKPPIENELLNVNQPEAFLRAVDKAAVADSAWRFMEPVDLLTAVQRVMQLGDLKMPDGYKKLEFNRLILRVDGFLLDRQRSNQSLTPPETKALSGLWDKVSKSKEPYYGLFTAQEKKYYFEQANCSDVFSSTLAHTEYLEQIDYYKSRSYLGRFRSFVKPENWNDLFPSAKKSPGEAFNPNPWSMIPESLSKEALMSVKLPQGVEVERVFFEKRDGRLTTTLPWNLRPIIEARAWTELLPHLSNFGKVEYVKSQDSNEASKMYAFLSNSVFFPNESNDGRWLADYIEQLRTNEGKSKTAKNELSVYDRAYRTIWSHRAEVALLSVRDPLLMNWSPVFKYLGLTEEQGYKELNEAVKTFTHSNDVNDRKYAELLNGIREISKKYNASVQTEYKETGSKNWMTRETLNYVRGDFNAALQHSEGDRELAAKLFLPPYYYQNTGHFQEDFRKTLSELLQKKGTIQNEEEFYKLLQETNKKMGLEYSSDVFQVLANLESEHAVLKPIQESPAISRRLKRSLLSSILFSRNFSKKPSYSISGVQSAEAFQQAAKDLGIAKTASAFLKWVNTEGKDIKLSFKILSLLIEPLNSAYQKAKTQGPEAQKKWILDSLELFELSQGDKAFSDDWAKSMTRSKGTGDLNFKNIKSEILADCGGLDFSPEQAKRIFFSFNFTGATVESDRYFKEKVRPSVTTEELKKILAYDYISSDPYRLSLVKEDLIRPEIVKLDAAKNTNLGIYNLVSDLNGWLPTTSTGKDRLLDDLAWKVAVKNPAMQQFINEQKSTNWRKNDPLFVNLLSATANLLSTMPDSEREELLNHLMSPETVPFPDSVEKKLLLELGGYKFDYSHRQEVQSGIEAMKRHLREMGDVQRIPIIELTLTAGQSAPSNKHDWIEKLVRDRLGYEPNSDYSILVQSYLDVIPPEEIPATLSYLIATKHNSDGSIKSLFEVFKTVGIKFGQIGSIWNLFPEEVKSLKESADPMTLTEVETVLESRLSPREKALIKRPVKVLGSAGIKTIVLIELQDGTFTTAGVRRANAEAQIKMNLKMGKDFLRSAEKRGLQSGSPLYKQIAESMEPLFLDEINFVNEATKIREYGSVVKKVEKDLKLGPKWRLSSISVDDRFSVHEDLIFTNFVKGVSFDQLPEGAAKREVGRIITRAAFKSLFKYGYFDADRHKGNQLNDLRDGGGEVSLIDLGQLAKYSKKNPWTSDDRLDLADFIMGIKFKNSDQLLRAALNMSKIKELSPSKKAELARDLDSTLKNMVESDPSVSLRKLIDVFAKHDLILQDRMISGPLLGLMKIYGENYVPADEFHQFLGEEVGSLKATKVIATLRARPSLSELTDFASCIRERFRMKTESSNSILQPK